MKHRGRPPVYTLYKMTKTNLMLAALSSVIGLVALIGLTTLIILFNISLILTWALKLPFRAGFYLVRHRWGQYWLFMATFIALVYLAGVAIQFYKLEKDQNIRLNHKVFALEQKLRDETERNDALALKLEEKQEDRGRFVSPESKGYIVNLVKQYFGVHADSALKVFNCESGLSPFNYHKNKEGLGADLGVAQVNSKYHQARFEKMYGIPFEIGAYIPELNVKYAKFLHDHSGFGPWVCSKIVGVNA
jgi:hypothetical protein